MNATNSSRAVQLMSMASLLTGLHGHSLLAQTERRESIEIAALQFVDTSITSSLTEKQGWVQEFPRGLVVNQSSLGTEGTIFDAARSDLQVLDPELVRQVNAVPRMRVSPLTEVVQCGKAGPGSCRMLGTDLFVTLGRPVLAGSGATIDVDCLYRSGSKRTPVANIVYRLTLKQEGANWRVIRSELLSQS